MFNTDLDKDASAVNLRRRAFLGFSVTAIAGAAVWSMRKPRTIAAASPAGAPEEVTVVRFSDSGQRLQKVRVPKVVKSEEEWRKQLSQNEFDITRHADTEIAGTGRYAHSHDKGLYRCVCCGTALFSSDTKFESGTGWPSFWQPIAPENIGPSGIRVMAKSESSLLQRGATRTWVTYSMTVRHRRACAIA